MTISLWHYGVKGMHWGVTRTPEELGHESGVAKSQFSVTIDDSGHYVSEKGFAIHTDKITRFCLNPKAKHFKDFEDVGYTAADAERLLLDIEKGFDIEKKQGERLNQTTGHKEYFIPMELGVEAPKTFRTAWMEDRQDGKPRFISAYRDEELGKKGR